jgi:membrane-bound lytic murein transglycosylase D
MNDEMNKMRSMTNTTRSLIITISAYAILMSSCSVFKGEAKVEQEPEALSVEDYEQVEHTKILPSSDIDEDSLTFSDEIPSYEDNSLSDSTWVADIDKLHSDNGENAKIESVNSLWLDQVSSYMFGEEYNYDDKFEVIKESDSIIKLRLAKLNSQTPIDLDYNPVVQSFIEMYVYKRASQLSRMMGLAEYYYPMFEQTLDKYDIPLELKHLAIVESALNPRARSHVGAAGLWQFMYATGKMYNLKVSSYVDERFDPIKATDASARMMSDLYKMFGDWNLVLAAYNSGPGNVRKAIRRSGGYKNFWYIRPYLPRETRNYVPAFIAVNYAMNHALDHNIKPTKPIISFLETDTLVVKSTITFDQIQNEIEIPKEELSFLNPSYKHGIIPLIEGKNYMLVLPNEYMDIFVSREDSIYARVDSLNKANIVAMPKYYEANDRIRYRVRSGDNLGYIAEKYGVKVSEIKRWNGLKSNNIYIGQRLSIYPRKFNQKVSSNSSKKSTSKKSSTKVKFEEIKGEYSIYTVKSGDNLWLIAKKYPGISAQNIMSWNKISDARNIKVGMKLKIAKQS